MRASGDVNRKVSFVRSRDARKCLSKVEIDGAKRLATLAQYRLGELGKLQP